MTANQPFGGATAKALLQAFNKHFQKVYEDMKASVPTGGQTGWQPIETAPKDGTDVLLWAGLADVSSGCYEIGFWGDPSFDSGPGLAWIEGRDRVPLSPRPTHWMPLPVPPVDADSKP